MTRRKRPVASRPAAHELARRRAIVLASGLAAVYALILLRAFQLQVLRGPELEEIARRQHERTISLRSRRGAILDRNQRPLAVSVDAKSVYADPRELDEHGRAELARVLGLTREDLEKRLAKGEHFAWVERGALPDRVEDVRDLKLPGIGFLPESRRYYPNRELAAAVLGVVGVDGKGLAGLEAARDDALSGSSIELVATRDAFGRPLHPRGIDADLSDRSGVTVVLTVDASIQEIAETELARAVDTHDAVDGIVVVLEPATGDVLAMATVPGFNPNDFGNSEAVHRRPRGTSDVQEPGSPLKAILVAAALEHGTTDESREYDVGGGRWRIDGHTLHDVKPHDVLSLADVIRFSSNIGAAQIALELGPYRYGRSLAAFGFGARTEVGLPGESAGIVRDPRSWNRVELATIGFGQGISTTALQLASAFATIANDGVRMRPRLVREIRTAGGTTIAVEPPEELARPISPDVAKRVTEMLEGATEPDGTGHAAVPDGVRVAGKTGTAQKALENGRGYARDRWIASFAGFAPVEDPRLAVLVVVNEPKGSAYGGVVAAPVFRAIVERALPIVELRGQPAPSAPVFDDAALSIASLDGDTQRADAQHTTRARTPRSADEVLASLNVPDFVGLTMRGAQREAAAAAMAVDPHGRGICVRQDPAAGVSRGEVERVKLWFQAPAEAALGAARIG